MAQAKEAGMYKVMKPNLIQNFLENLSESADRECLLFTEISCKGEECENLAKSCEEIKDVTIVDFSLNNLADISSMKDTLTRLVKLNLASNRIKNAGVFAMDDAFMNLKWLDISNNKFTEWPAFKCPKLDYLNFSGNNVDKISADWGGHPTLRILSCAGNKFKNLALVKNCTRLEELYLGNNLIATLGGCEGGLPALKRLHLRRNKVAAIEDELPEMPELEYLNLRHNAIDSIESAVKVFQFPKIIDLNVVNNPIDLNASSFNLLMAEFLVKRTALVRFCKHTIKESNKLEAVHLAQYRWGIEEEKRKAAAAADL